MKNILFITWDGPQTSYMEGLFMPIFHEISKRQDIHFHVIQFTWADRAKTDVVKKNAQGLGIHYTAFPILKKPVASLGSLITLFTSSRNIKKYIQKHRIDIVMPRSTFPAFMVSRLLKSVAKVPFRGFRDKIIFDADGLPIDERVDFAGLKKDSRQYRWMKSIETQMLKRADRVITRSQKSIEVHLENIGEHYRNKFSVVFNGRDAQAFAINPEWRRVARSQLNIKEELVFVYAGSLGPQYHLPEMLQIVSIIEHAHFLLLTGNTEFAMRHVPEALRSKVTVKKVPVHEVPFWLNAADVAFALRTPSFSMQGVAPIKLGEYLLCGLPTIASKGIGDSDRILEQFNECLLYDHKHPPAMEDLLKFTEKAKFADREKIRQKSLRFFSLDAAADSYLKLLKKL